MSARGEAVKVLLQRTPPVPPVSELKVDVAKLGRAIAVLVGGLKGGGRNA
ncbi:hypothetical protein EDD38_7462 [Kitasatospora cineracea]|uniref:Uncharacterized protein n=1 Tax=Kitasatospora cineracea TaxID=88074 RepID=A0A3N4RFZ5_9ACTN|nr:hypothetical protein EDD38_7462 [Kitasatospora cineracea]